MNLSDNKNISLGISEKKDGPMKFSPENRSLFFKKHGLNDKIIVSAGLVHGKKVAIVDHINKSQAVPDCDALITDSNKYLLTITVADCLPLYFYDKNKKVVALAHAGWRGVVSEIARELINIFVEHYHSDLADIEVFIGPHIKDCHFEVKNDVASQFKVSETIVRDKKIYINLSQTINEQLVRQGILSNNIFVSEECTYCLANKYFSYRRDNPKELETMVAYISL